MTVPSHRSIWMGRSSAAVAWVIAVAWFYLGFIFSRFSRFEGDWGRRAHRRVDSESLVQFVAISGKWLDPAEVRERLTNSAVQTGP